LELKYQFTAAAAALHPYATVQRSPLANNERLLAVFGTSDENLVKNLENKNWKTKIGKPHISATGRFLSFSYDTTLYPGGIRSHDP
jgi:hypothetical protein